MTHDIRLVDLTLAMQHNAMSWARANCPSFRALFVYNTGFVREDDPGNFEFVFEQEQDAILFGLKFGSY